MSDKQVTVGDLVFSYIDSNEFLKQLYANLLYNYGLHQLGLVDRQSYDVDLEAALRFADLLSKSIHPTNRDRHRVCRAPVPLPLPTRCTNESVCPCNLHHIRQLPRPEAVGRDFRCRHPRRRIQCLPSRVLHRAR